MRVPDYAGRVGFRADWRQFGTCFPGIVRRRFPDSLVWKENTNEAGFQSAPTMQAGRPFGPVYRFLRSRDARRGLCPTNARGADPLARETSACTKPPRTDSYGKSLLRHSQHRLSCVESGGVERVDRAGSATRWFFGDRDEDQDGRSSMAGGIAERERHAVPAFARIP